jgi:peptide deformylase
VGRSESSQDDWEGCFSVPGLMGLVPRADTITVQYLSGDSQRVTEEYTGYVARVIQHEVDHLDGVEFVDRMTSLQSLTTVQNYLQHQRHNRGEA